MSVGPAGSCAQDLIPGAYTPAPIGVNIVTIAGAFSHGDVAFDTSSPAEDGRATVGATIIGFNRTLELGGRFASVGGGVPLMFGHVEGRVLGQFHEVSRRGVGDAAARFAINLYGAPAMTREQFASYRPTTVVGASLSVVAPTGQYNPAQYINLGTNRWSFKPEVGLARTRGRWTFEADLGAAFFTDNTDFANGGTRHQAPVFSAQGHLIHHVRPGFWIAADGNYWRGGRATVDGVSAVNEQRNSRVGVTLAVPIRRQQVRISYSFGAFTTTGGDFHSVGMSYSYAWVAGP